MKIAAARRKRTSVFCIHGGPQRHVDPDGTEDERVQPGERLELAVRHRPKPPDEAPDVPVTEGARARRPSQLQDVRTDQQGQVGELPEGTVGPADPLVARAAIVGDHPARLQASHHRHESRFQGEGAGIPEPVHIDDQELTQFRFQRAGIAQRNIELPGRGQRIDERGLRRAGGSGNEDKNQEEPGRGRQWQFCGHGSP